MHSDTSCVRSNFRRKQYAYGRLHLATARLMRADSDVEKVMATRWVNAWAGAIGSLKAAEDILCGGNYPKLRRMQISDVRAAASCFQIAPADPEQVHSGEF
jgi:hypothetical protein